MDLVSQTPRPRGRGRPFFADCGISICNNFGWVGVCAFAWDLEHASTACRQTRWVIGWAMVGRAEFAYPAASLAALCLPALFREIPPGLLRHVLIVLVFWSWVLPLSRLPTWSRPLRLFPWASILLYGPLDIPWICCSQLPHHPCKNGTHSTCFYSTGGHTQICIP